MGDSVIQEEQMNSSGDYDYLIKLLALGNTAVGKTSILFHYTDASFNSKFVSTVGIDFRAKRLKHQVTYPDSTEKGKEYKIQLQLWDTAGQERFRALSTAFLREAMGFLLVFDVTNEESFHQIRNWLSLLKTYAYCAEPDMILVGNKMDLEECRAVSRVQAQTLADQLNIPYMETSALTGDNIQEVVAHLLNMIMMRIERSVEKTRFPIQHNLDVSKLKLKEEKNSHCSC